MSFNEVVTKNLKEDFKVTDRMFCRLFLIIIRLRIYLFSHFNIILLKYLLLIPVEIVYIIYCRTFHNCEVSRKANIGPGFQIHHPYNLFIGEVDIGVNCTMGHEVTLGYAVKRGVSGVPKLGDNVLIGVGAKIVGPVRVGNNVKIGANAVVFDDIPDNAIVFNTTHIKYADESASS